MKKKALLLSLLFPLLCTAQSVVHYAYDTAGNRVRREIVISQQQAPNLLTRSADFSDEVAGGTRLKIRVTGSTIRVEAPSADREEEGSVTAYSLSGTKVGYSVFDGGIAVTDLNGSPAGVYILHIEIGNKSTDWKIIKK